MTDSKLEQRRKLYYELNARISQISNSQLQTMLAGDQMESSWGDTHTLDVAGSRVFVKRVPITELEYADMFSTRNFYDLPTFYNYPFNSGGFGVFRELVAHIKTTNWVLDGSIANFPMMYHYRIVPHAGERKPLEKARLDRYVEYWGGDANVGRYILDRTNANYELLLFLEHFPHGDVSRWLLQNPTRTQDVLDEMHATIDFLNERKIMHFDSHFHNIVTDGEQSYLTDFGLVLDRSFELSPAEEEFYEQNSYYDYGNLLWSLVSSLASMYNMLEDEDKSRVTELYGLDELPEFDVMVARLLNDLDKLTASGIIKLDEGYADMLVKYREIILLMYGYYATMRANNRKDDKFDNAELHRLLVETGFLAD
ncbi:MAG: hypothetical protein ABIQ44_03825 [Chloroflexia bacterium]